MNYNIVAGSIEEMIGKLEKNIIELREEQHAARVEFRNLPFYKRIFLKRSYERFEETTQFKIERLTQLIKNILITEIREKDEEIRALSKFIKPRGNFSPMDLPIFSN